MNQDTKKLNELTLLIKKCRILLDIYGHLQEIEKRKPDVINNDSGFFSNSWKLLKNSWNDGSFQKANENLIYKVGKYNEISDVKITSNIKVNEVQILTEKISDQASILAFNIFKDDRFKLGKIEYVINVIMDNSIKYEQTNLSYELISLILDEEDSFVNDIKNELFNAYKSISIKGANMDGIKLTAGLLTGVIILTVINPLIGGTTASAAVTTGSLGGMFFGIGMAESVLALCGCSAVTYLLLEKGIEKADLLIQKNKLRKDFYKLDLNQTTVSLAKSIVMITQINKYRSTDSLAEKIYSEFIENYIDIKSDITLNMLLSIDGISNFEKTKVFNNVDKYLVNKLSIA